MRERQAGKRIAITTNTIASGSKMSIQPNQVSHHAISVEWLTHCISANISPSGIGRVIDRSA